MAGNATIGTPLNLHQTQFMTTIRDFMAQDHLHCDEVLAPAERLAIDQNWDAAAAAFTHFKTLVLQHFNAEETLLFPAFEERTGMHMGPTQAMRGEHVQMRQLMDAASAALVEMDGDDYAGYTETLLIMMQQHNMKEESMLYPMCDQYLSDQTSVLLPKLQALLPGTAT